MNLDEQKRALIEKVGIFHERMGLQPVACRILGLLYVSDRPELTFDEIREALSISKSATSNAINLLLQIKRLEYITFSGDRKRYFRLCVSRWRDLITSEVDGIVDFSHVLREVLQVRSKETPEYNARIAEFSDFMDYLHRELPRLLQKWEESRT